MFFWRVYEFSFVFGWFSRKLDEISKIWVISGVLHRDVGIPRNSVGRHQGVACPRRGVACPRCGVAEREAWSSLGYAVT